jgi:hypothetical protein
MSADELRDETGAPERNPLPEEVAEGETETERNLEQAGGGENPSPRRAREPSLQPATRQAAPAAPTARKETTDDGDESRYD